MIDFLHPDRVIIGVAAPAQEGLAAALRRLYEPLQAPILVTDLTSAETIKVASNVFLASKIAFADELARLCAATGADVQAVVDGTGLDRRIGRQFLSPGPGFGGSCFPSQSRAMPALAERLGIHNQLMAAIWPSNADQAAWFVERAEETFARPLAGAHVAPYLARRSRPGRTTCVNHRRCAWPNVWPTAARGSPCLIPAARPSTHGMWSTSRRRLRTVFWSSAWASPAVVRASRNGRRRRAALSISTRDGEFVTAAASRCLEVRPGVPTVRRSDRLRRVETSPA